MTDATASQAPPSAESGEVWTSRLGFVLATAAAAIGLGSLWRFPYVAGMNGGGAFVLIYTAFVVALCIPLMIAEMVMGKRGHGSVVATLRRLVTEEGASPAWRVIGWLSVAVPFFGLSYYSVVAGWCVDYAREAVFSGFAGTDADSSTALFETLIAGAGRQALIQFGFIFFVAIVVAIGVQRGIEAISRIKMIALAVVLVGLVIYNAITFDIGETFVFLLRPNFGAVTGASVLTAFGQALFSTAIGAGVLMTYSAYLPRGVSIAQSAGIVSLSVIVVAMFAGLAIFPIALSSGLGLAEGPNLIFVTLPVAFGDMPGGRLVAIVFFALISLGAFTTAVGMLEPVVAWLRELTGWRRAPVAFATALATWVIGLPSLLSFGPLADVYPLAIIPGFETKTFFDTLDFGIAEMLLPINALLIALFAGWAMKSLSRPSEDFSAAGLAIWRAAIRFLVPAAIIILLLNSLIS
ncbi:sodium-dependent transporter [Novosphingobium sp. PC22D]|uniref:sodium-dependent transporter n=1 Tax=Novosphingobium sp. PC22D TaxID=1962403 RepID=UPI000BF0E684|nr:sodium-dependent transporter [Novosphingobium sp. PC22D]PEQ13078.1 sodium-dependent transporter [Novosphingobium sp. PC22D]